MIEQANFKVKASNAFTTVCPFPVGYIYMASTSTSPASTFGGTWTAVTDGRLWSPSNSYNTTSGSWTHTLTVNEMPPHVHGFDTKPNQGPYCGWNTSAGGGDKLLYGSCSDGRIIYEFIGQTTDYSGGGHLIQLRTPAARAIVGCALPKGGER